MKKLPYVPPLILREMEFCVEKGLLAGSIVDKTTVTSVGQEVQSLDWSTGDFNHTWGE